MKNKINNNPSSISCIYLLGIIGSGVYFNSVATGFWVGLLGILKALIWPVFLVYEAFNFLYK